MSDIFKPGTKFKTIIYTGVDEESTMSVLSSAKCYLNTSPIIHKGFDNEYDIKVTDIILESEPNSNRYYIVAIGEII